MKSNKIVSVFCLLAMMLPMGAFAQAARYKVGACDWMMLKRQKLGEFKLAHEIGCDGVELDMGGLGKRDSFANQLRGDKAQALKFKNTAKEYGIEVGAVAMSGFYGQDLTKKDTYMWLAEDCFNTMDIFGTKIAFLPLGGTGKDWYENKAKRKEVVKRLKRMGNAAAKRGKVIGIDTRLDAAASLKLLKEINSKGIKIFYKWQTQTEEGRDIAKDIAMLGAKNICAFHASNTDGKWLRNDNTIDVAAIKAALDKMGWSGWLFVERSRDTTQVRNVKANYGDNVNFLKYIFQNGGEVVALKSEGRPADYVNSIVKRSEKVTNALGLTGSFVGLSVRNIVANRYFALNDIYTVRDSIKNHAKKTLEGEAKNAAIKNAENETDSKLYRSHAGFIADLSIYLNDKQIETVKDVMTYNVVNVTYTAQCDMIPTLKEEEKAQILAWLKEAREFAIDAENSNKKHAAFGKYKGRINNYLSKRGYDLVKEREGWYKRIKARGGTI